MPAAPPGSKVLVTGANGFVAMWVIRTLLQQGFSVRGTIRSVSKGDHLRKVFRKYGDKLELVLVPDIEKEGAFDEAVRGVAAIEHTASPYHYDAEDPAEIIDPAIRGTLSVLKSALKNGPTVKRIVYTTSTATMVRPTKTPLIFDESSWNEHAIQEVQKKGRDAPGYLKYFASKTLAEKAFFEFHEKHKHEIGWDVVSIAPPYVFGPMIHNVKSLEQANTSVLEWYQTMMKHPKLLPGGASAQPANTPEALITLGNAWLDVRDLAKAHVRAIQREEATGRIIVSAGAFVWHDFLDVCRSLQPPVYPVSEYVDPNPSYDPRKAVHLLDFNVSKAERVLGIGLKQKEGVDAYISIEKLTRDMLDDFKRRGW